LISTWAIYKEKICEAGTMMNIHTDEYQIAPFNEDDQTLKAIQQTEALLFDLTGKEFTLIAYEKNQE
jgi:hypothetical protein